MTDEIDKLRVRLSDVEKALEAAPSGRVGSSEWNKVVALTEERGSIELVLAQLEVATATREAAAAQRDAAQAQQRATDEREHEKQAQDDAAFWFRRFILSLQIGNGAGFLALATGVLQADNFNTVARLAVGPFLWFGAGTIVAGIVPGILYIERLQKRANLKSLAQAAAIGAGITGAMFFIFAVVASYGSVLSAAIQPPPVEQKPATPARPESPAPTQAKSPPERH